MQFKKTLLSAAAMLVAGTLSASLMAAPVTTEGTGVGKHGDITVAVTFDNGKIQDIKVVKTAENPILAQKVFTELKDEIVAQNSTELDMISGATFSSKGLVDAVNDAAKKAGVTLGKADKKALKKVARDLPKTATTTSLWSVPVAQGSPLPLRPRPLAPMWCFLKRCRQSAVTP